MVQPRVRWSEARFRVLGAAWPAVRGGTLEARCEGRCMHSVRAARAVRDVQGGGGAEGAERDDALLGLPPRPARAAAFGCHLLLALEALGVLYASPSAVAALAAGGRGGAAPTLSATRCGGPRMRSFSQGHFDRLRLRRGRMQVAAGGVLVRMLCCGGCRISGLIEQVVSLYVAGLMERDRHELVRTMGCACTRPQDSFRALPRSERAARAPPVLVPSSAALCARRVVRPACTLQRVCVRAGAPVPVPRVAVAARDAGARVPHRAQRAAAAAAGGRRRRRRGRRRRARARRV